MTASTGRPWAVHIAMPDTSADIYVATLLDEAPACELWSGQGTTLDRALVDLIENMADELEERGKHLPDDYRDLAAR